MHRALLKALDDATGQSEMVVAVFLDIRGFTSFSKAIGESLQTALYLKSIYRRILTEYLPDAAFFKPTGDGLMLIYQHDDKNLREVVNHVVSQSLKLVDDFESLTKDDDMVNFPVPSMLGVGISRMGATRLVSKGKTLDYSGRPLNLAARLMDLARPSGVVLDGALGAHLLSKSLQARFTEDEVFVKGIADARPMEVLASERVRISQRARLPANRYEPRMLRKKSFTYREFKAMGRFMYELPEYPDLPVMRVDLRHAQVVKKGQKFGENTTYHQMPAYLTERMTSAWITFEPEAAFEHLDDIGYRPGWTIDLFPVYNVLEGSPLPEKVHWLEPDDGGPITKAQEERRARKDAERKAGEAAEAAPGAEPS